MLSAQLSVSVSSATVDCGADEVVIDVVVDDFTDVTTLEFSVVWDESELSIDGYNDILLGSNPLNLTTNPLEFFNITSNGGRQGVNFGYTSASILAGTTLSGPTTIFSLRLSVLSLPADIAIGGSAGFTVTYAQVEGSPLPQDVTPNTSGGTVTQGSGGTDTTDPTISCPAEVSETTTGSNLQINSGLEPTATDDCGTPSISYVLERNGGQVGSGNGNANGVTFEEGVTTVTYTATDGNNNTASCSFTVTVTVDNGSTGPVTFSLDNQNGDCNTTNLSFDVTVANFTGVIGTSFTLEWPSNILSFASVSNFNTSLNPSITIGNFGTGDTDNGVLGFLWAANGLSGQNLDNADVLFTINFTPGVDFAPGANVIVSFTSSD
ncbi:MAG: HYR domain-containing protein, partial [Bacteroidota bacterium]